MHVGSNGPPDYFSVTPTGSYDGVTCHPPTGAARLFVMAPVLSYRSESTGGEGDEYLGYLAGYHHLDYGSCASLGQAFESWTGPSGSGNLACMNPYDGRPWIYFTFGEGRYLAFATRDDSNCAALYQWWEQLKTFLP